MTATSSNAQGIDPRGPRFGATITLIFLTVTLALFLGTQYIAATAVLAYIVVIFAIGAFAGISRHPYGYLFKKLVRPRLQPPAELEDVKPPTFAQLIGFVITAAGLVFALLGLYPAAIVAVAFAFVAAFLNSVFGYCLGCQMYVLLARAGIVGKKASPAS